MSNIIFVYGTLKRGHGNYDRFLASDSIYLGEAVSVDADYAILLIRSLMKLSIPILFKDQPNGHRVKGELFEVSDDVLARLDQLEGHPRSYRREQRQFVATTITTVAVLTAWVYLSPHPFPESSINKAAPINEQGWLVWPPEPYPFRSK